MSEARALPVLGALLGALLGLVTMGLLTVLGVLAPDRLPLFALVGAGLIVGATLLTQRIALAKKRMVSAIVVSAILVGVSLTGIPEVVRGGSVSAGCLATGASSLENTPLSPANTSATSGFSMTPTDTIDWTTQTSVPVTQGTAAVSLRVGGFDIPVRTFQFAEAPEVTSWSGQAPVGPQLESIEQNTGFRVTGIYHAAVHLDAGTGECTGNAYFHIVGDGPFDGTLLILLWTALAVLVIALLVLTVVVRRSIRESDRTLAMVGMSAIPGETSTSAPISPSSPASSNGPSEPTQPTVPDPARKSDRDPRRHAQSSEKSRSTKSVGSTAHQNSSQANQSTHDEDSLGEPSVDNAEGEGDPRIGEGEEKGEAPQTEPPAAASDSPHTEDAIEGEPEAESNLDRPNPEQ